MVAVSEAVGTERHALGNPAGLATEGNEVSRPHQAAHHCVVVLLGEEQMEEQRQEENQAFQEKQEVPGHSVRSRQETCHHPPTT